MIRHDGDFTSTLLSVVGCLRASESRQNTGKGGYAEKISPHIMTYMVEAVI